ncbi:MAG: helix-turn-helix transcriptional regulator [Bacteroidales bacterium]|nr:helix-turn-helix transcriptional regulator [Bacteroidales bacterium]
MNLNIQPIYNIDPTISPYSETVKATEERNAISRDRNLDIALSEWAKRPEKPFLNDDITLASVAESLNVSPRLLSAYLNQIYTTNFNTWINTLRIKEVKRLIDDSSQKTLAQIAIQTGFTDQAAMANTFKRLTNMTPSEYRKQKNATETDVCRSNN